MEGVAHPARSGVRTDDRHANGLKDSGVSMARQPLVGGRLSDCGTTREHWSLPATASGPSELLDATMTLVLWMQHQHTAGVGLGANHSHAGGLSVPLVIVFVHPDQPVTRHA